MRVQRRLVRRPAGRDVHDPAVVVERGRRGRHEPLRPRRRPTAPYFNSFPVLPDMLKLDRLRAHHSPRRASRSRSARARRSTSSLFSDAPTTGPWKVTALRREHVQRRQRQPRAHARQDHRAERRHAPPHHHGEEPDATLGVEAFVIVSDYGTPGDPDFQDFTMTLVAN